MADNYKNTLLISSDYLKSVTNLSENIDDDYILPAIRLSQDIELEATIGTALTNKIKEIIADNTIGNEENKFYKILLDDYIQMMLAYYTVANLTLPISIKFNNFGLTRTDDDRTYNISFDELGQIKEYYSKYADYYKYRLQLYLIENYFQFPELQQWHSIDELQTNLYSASGCSIWLGGARGKSFVPMDRDSYLWSKYNFPSGGNKKVN